MKGKSKTPLKDASSDTEHQQSMVEEFEATSKEKEGEDRSLDVALATTAPGKEYGIAAVLVMMEQNHQEESVKRERENEKKAVRSRNTKIQMDLLQEELNQSRQDRQQKYLDDSESMRVPDYEQDRDAHVKRNHQDRLLGGITKKY